MRSPPWAKPAAVPHRCRLDHAASGLRQARAAAGAAATARTRSTRRGPAHARRGARSRRPATSRSRPSRPPGSPLPRVANHPISRRENGRYIGHH